MTRSLPDVSILTAVGTQASRVCQLAAFVSGSVLMALACHTQAAIWSGLKLTASDGAAAFRFGTAVAISSGGATVLVGSPGVDAGGVDQVGAASIYRQWTETKLTPSDGDLRDWFGAAVALSADGNTALVGARGDPGFSQPGAVYVYRWTGVQWEETKLTPAVPTDAFGNSVSLSADGTTAAVGSEEFNFGTGAAHIFRWNGTQWVDTQLTASDGLLDDRFGSAVSLSGDGNTLIVGSRLADIVGESNRGSAYIFEWDGISWSETAKLTATDGASFDRFGTSVGISFGGDTATVGSPGRDVVSNDEGQVYLYQRDGVGWLETKLTASDGVELDWFGISVALTSDGTRVIVGSVPAGAEPAHSGAAYLYESAGGGLWTETKLVASDGAIDDFFGCAVALNTDGATAIIGASNATVGSNPGQGAAYLFAPQTSSSPATGAGMVSRDDGHFEFAVRAKYHQDQLDGSLFFVEQRAGGMLMLRGASAQALTIVGNTGVALFQATLPGTGDVLVRATLVDNSVNGEGDQFGLRVTRPDGSPVADLSFDPLTLTAGNIRVSR